MKVQGQDNANTRLRINLIFLVVAVVLSYYFTQLRFGLNLQFELASPESLVEGTAKVPYQFRVLVPWLVGLLLDLPFIRPDALANLFRLSELLALVGLVIAFRHYLSFFFNNILVSSVLAFSLFYVLPFNFLMTYWYPYDIPSVLFFTLGLILLYRQKWVWYYPLFIIATFNRETTLFLVFIFVVTSIGNTSTRRIIQHTAAQLIIWLAIRLLLQAVFADNPEGFEWLPVDNLLSLLQPFNLFWLLVNWGMLWVPALLGYRWIQDRFVRRSLLVLFPFLATAVAVGSITELRIYGEMIPVVVPAALLALQALFIASSQAETDADGQ